MHFSRLQAKKLTKNREAVVMAYWFFIYFKRELEIGFELVARLQQVCSISNGYTDFKA